MTDWLGTLAPAVSTMATAIALLLTNHEAMARIRRWLGRGEKSKLRHSDRKEPWL